MAAATPFPELRSIQNRAKFSLTTVTEPPGVIAGPESCVVPQKRLVHNNAVGVLETETRRLDRLSTCK